MGKAPAIKRSSGDNVVSLEHRTLGSCFACALPVHFGDNYIRLRGQPVHLSCALVAARTMRDGPGSVRP
jgi:hypothetical protein